MVKRTLRTDNWSPNSRLYFSELREITVNKSLPLERSPQKPQIGEQKYLERPTPGPEATMAEAVYRCGPLLPPAVESLGRVRLQSVFQISTVTILLPASLKPLLSRHYLSGFIHLDFHL